MRGLLMELTHTAVMLVVLITLLFCSAFFSGSETALMAISKLRLRHLAKTMPKRAASIERLLKEPERLIGTILLGNNLVNVAMSAIATVLAISVWGEAGIIYVTGFLTVAILIFAEITPKVYAKYFNERVSVVVAPIMHIIMLIFNPIVFVVTFVTNKLMLLIGIDVKKAERILFTEAEVKTCIDLAKDHGTISADEKKLLSRVFTLNDKTVEQVMVPKEKMRVIDEKASLNDILEIMRKTGYSRFPVVKGSGIDVIGMLYTKDVLSLSSRKKPGPIRKIVRPAYFISGDKTIDSQLRSFRIKRIHQAVVLGNDAKPIGLITLEDILEELVGSIKDEHDFD
jgi:putative hemolysin